MSEKESGDGVWGLFGRRQSGLGNSARAVSDYAEKKIALVERETICGRGGGSG